MKIKREEVVYYLNGLNSVVDISGLKFAYAVSKNLKALQDEAKEINKKRFPEATDEVVKFEEEKVKLLEKFAKKDNNGNYIPDKATGGMFLDDKDAYMKEYEKLLSKHPKAKKQIEEHNKFFKEFIQEVIDVKIFTIKKDDLPDSISARQLNAIDFMIE